MWASEVTWAVLQAASRGQKQAAPTQPDENDPLRDKYGDTQLIQSQSISKRTWTRVEALDKSLENQQVLWSCMHSPIYKLSVEHHACMFCTHYMTYMQVLLRGRVATVRGKGKSCFIVLRQRTATVQVTTPHVMHSLLCCVLFITMVPAMAFS